MKNDSDVYGVILQNACVTPDGTWLESEYRWDYKEHTDAITGEVYMRDGGRDYVKCSVNTVPAVDHTVYAHDPIEKVREVFKWKTYGELQDHPTGYLIKLYEMTDEHISNILNTQQHIKGTYVEDVFKREMQYRKDSEIEVKG